MTIGARHTDLSHCVFSVWAPEKETMILHIVHPIELEFDMEKNEYGYFTAKIEGLKAGTRYFFKPDNKESYPDPASHYQPDGVHGPSEVIDHNAYKWNDEDWRNIPLKDMILYELHVGTFTPEGTFEGIIPRLDDLIFTGINAIELMPVAQFPGNRNWGYDAAYPFAVQNSYGGPEGFKKLIDACHQKGIAVFLDVIYNHLGPEGNYFPQFGPYFTRQYATPWGDAINFDGDYSDGVREYFSENILHWFEHYHVDGLRCDAIHRVYDIGAVSFWELCYDKVKHAEAKLGRKLYMTAESDLNNPRVASAPETGGFGFDAQWLDDFHHSLYVLLDKCGKERYKDFGRLEQLAKAFTDGFVHSGEYVDFRKRKHGRSSAGVPGYKFIVFNQNHDQVGNRVNGERLCMLVNFERQKIAAAAILLSPYVPMIFMGEEYSDQSPFYYFVSHSDPDLIKAVQDGRKREFAGYNGNVEPPDPQDDNTFKQCILNWEARTQGNGQLMLNWFKTLIELRKANPVLQNFNKNDIRATVVERDVIVLHRKTDEIGLHLLCIFNFSENVVPYVFPDWKEKWFKILDSHDKQWNDNSKCETTTPHVAAAREHVQIAGLNVMVFSSAIDS